MATIYGTSGADVYELKTNDLYEALEGDDRVTISGRWGTVQPGPGNDTVIIDPALRPYEATVWYWGSPSVITVDLEQGYALDGYGTRDTLVNVHNVHGFKRPGDKGLGSSTSDYFWVGPDSGQKSGVIQIDGRGGVDEVTLSIGDSPDRGRLVMQASADGRFVKAHFSAVPNFTFEFRNVEWLNLRIGNNQERLWVGSMNSFETAGQDILLRGAAGWQTLGPAAAITVSYSFMTERPADGAEGGSGFALFSAAQQKIVRDMFDRLQSQTGITFREVAGGAGDIRFGINQQTQTRGYSFVPDFHRGQAKAGDVWLDVESAAAMNPGQEGFYALLHETGHALGLQHPLGETDASGAIVLLDQYASLSNTVMIERSAAETNGLWPTWFGAMDMQALRYLYGNKPVATGNDRYVFNATALSYMSIMDDGGEDTLDASSSPLGVSLDLRPGHLSSVGLTPLGDSMKNNVAVGAGAAIEHAIGSVHDDLIMGTVGPNRLHGNGGSDVLDGNAGLDWAVFKGARNAWSVETALASGTWFVSSRDGSAGMAEVRQIERLRFDDKAIALDLTKNDNAGKALLLIGAVLGRDAMLSKTALMGQVIGLFDQGFTLDQLAGAVMRLPIWGGVLTPTDSPQDIARHLLRVTKGSEPSAAEVAGGALTISTQAQGLYLANLAVSDANVSQVGLVGLSATGFEYPPGG